MLRGEQVVEALKNSLNARQKSDPRYSLRDFGRDLGVSVSSLSEIIGGKRRPSRRLSFRIVKVLGLEKELGVDTEKMAASLADPQSRRVVYTRIAAQDTVSAVADWHHFAILSLMETVDFRSDPKWIANRLGISETRAKGSLRLLKRCGCIRKRKDGEYTLTGAPFASSDGIPSDAVRSAHRQYLNQSLEALDSVPLSQRDMTAFTAAVDLKLIPEAKEMIRKFGEKLGRFLESGHKQEVYRLCINLVPVSKTIEESAAESPQLN